MVTTALTTTAQRLPAIDVVIPRPIRRRREKPDDTAVKLAAIAAGKEITVEMLHNPFFSLIGGFMVIEVAQMIKPDGKHQLISDFLGSSVETLMFVKGGFDVLGSALGNAGIAKLLGVLIK